MTDYEPFARAIHDDPFSTVPALVWADKLEEDGIPGAAEVIRRAAAIHEGWRAEFPKAPFRHFATAYGDLFGTAYQIPSQHPPGSPVVYIPGGFSEKVVPPGKKRHVSTGRTLYGVNVVWPIPGDRRTYEVPRTPSGRAHRGSIRRTFEAINHGPRGVGIVVPPEEAHRLVSGMVGMLHQRTAIMRLEQAHPELRGRVHRFARPSPELPRDRMHAWLAPDGTVHPVGGASSHADWLTRSGTADSPDAAFRGGWHRLTYFGKQLYAHNPHARPTDRQAAALVDLAQQHGMDEVVHDDKRDERTLWSSRNRLARVGGPRRYNREEYNRLFREAAQRFHESLPAQQQAGHLPALQKFQGLDHYGIISRLVRGNDEAAHDVATRMLVGGFGGGKDLFTGHDPSRSQLGSRFLLWAKKHALDALQAAAGKRYIRVDGKQQWVAGPQQLSTVSEAKEAGARPVGGWLAGDEPEAVARAPKRVLSDQEKAEIHRLRDSGKSIGEIARHISGSKATVHSILKKRLARTRPVRYSAGHAEFHRAMADEPDNHLHSLVYADLLEEGDKPAHAEMIRRAIAQYQQGLSRPGLDRVRLHPWYPDYGESSVSSGSGEVANLDLGIRCHHDPEQEFRWEISGVPIRERADLIRRVRDEGGVVYGDWTQEVAQHFSRLDRAFALRLARAETRHRLARPPRNLGRLLVDLVNGRKRRPGPESRLLGPGDTLGKATRANTRPPVAPVAPVIPIARRPGSIPIATPVAPPPAAVVHLHTVLSLGPDGRPAMHRLHARDPDHARELFGQRQPDHRVLGVVAGEPGRQAERTVGRPQKLSRPLRYSASYTPDEVVHSIRTRPDTAPVIADYLEENGLHADDATLAHLRQRPRQGVYAEVRGGKVWAHPMIDLRSLGPMQRAYAEAALWASTDDDGTPLDQSHGIGDIRPWTLNEMAQDVNHFWRTLPDRLREVVLEDLDGAGHDLWLTRNGHGAGFWDGDWGEHGDELTDHVRRHFGEYDLYADDTGVHGQGYRRDPTDRPRQFSRLRYSHEGFARAFADSTEPDPTRSLVYADWLAESGMPAAESIVRAHVERDGRGPHRAFSMPLIADAARAHADAGVPAGHPVAGHEYISPANGHLIWVGQVHPGGRGFHYWSKVVRDRDEAQGLVNALRNEGAVIERESHRRRYAAYRAPAGGLIVRGQFYQGGMTVPNLQTFGNPKKPLAGLLKARKRAKKKLALATASAFMPLRLSREDHHDWAVQIAADPSRAPVYADWLSEGHGMTIDGLGPHWPGQSDPNHLRADTRGAYEALPLAIRLAHAGQLGEPAPVDGGRFASSYFHGEPITGGIYLRFNRGDAPIVAHLQPATDTSQPRGQRRRHILVSAATQTNHHVEPFDHRRSFQPSREVPLMPRTAASDPGLLADLIREADYVGRHWQGGDDDLIGQSATDGEALRRLDPEAAVAWLHHRLSLPPA